MIVVMDVMIGGVMALDDGQGDSEGNGSDRNEGAGGGGDSGARGDGREMRDVAAAGHDRNKRVAVVVVEVMKTSGGSDIGKCGRISD